jgi:hypothetical protein
MRRPPAFAALIGGEDEFTAGSVFVFVVSIIAVGLVAVGDLAHNFNEKLDSR